MCMPGQACQDWSWFRNTFATLLNVTFIKSGYKGDTNDYQIRAINDYINAFDVNYDVYAACFGVPLATATPQFTPTVDTGSDFCNEVEERPEYAADEIGISLPIPRFGEGSCIVIGGWSIDISWIEAIFPNLFQFNVPDTLGVPGFNLCLHPFTFGYMNLLGILLDMDVMFLLVSYIAVVRWLMRS